MSVFSVREHVLVRFVDDGELLHDRLILRSDPSSGWYVVCSPDRELMWTKLQVGSKYSEVYRWGGRKLPPGVEGKSTYLPRHSGYGNFSAEEIEDLVGDASRMVPPPSTRLRVKTAGDRGEMVATDRADHSKVDGALPGDAGNGGDSTPGKDSRDHRGSLLHHGCGVDDSGMRHFITNEGEVWATCEPHDRIPLGTVVSPRAGDVAVGDRAICHVEHDGCTATLFCRRLEATALPNLPRDLRRSLEKCGRAGEDDEDARARDDLEDDARTIAVQYDGQGDRWRSWKSVLAECSEPYFEDWPLEGPRTTMWLMKHIDRTGGSPMQWYHKFLAEARISPTDRSAYELQVMARMLEQAGCYDQVNLPALSCFEVLSRRWQLLLDANSRDPGDPKFDDEELWAGTSQRVVGISPQLTAHVASKTKEKAEIEKQRQKAKEIRSSPHQETSGGAPGGKKK